MTNTVYLPDALLIEVGSQGMATIKQAIEELDAIWAFEEARGRVDGWGGSEYRRESTAHQLRRMIMDNADEHVVDPRNVPPWGVGYDG